MTKFLIVGSNSINKEKIVDMLLINEDLFNIANIFTTEQLPSYKKYQYYLSQNELNICYKNNALLYVSTVDNISSGITLDSFYNNNIIFMNTEDFNNISNKIFTLHDDLVIIWLDSKDHSQDNIQKEIYETNYLLEKINSDNLKYLYFLDTDPIEIMDVIVEYLKNPEKRKDLIEQYS